MIISLRFAFLKVLSFFLLFNDINTERILESSTNITINLRNSYSLEYEQSFRIGNPPQTVTMIFDTSTSLIQVPSINCTNCLESPVFDCSISSSCSIISEYVLIKDFALGYFMVDDLYLTSNAFVSNQTMLLVIKEIGDYTEGVIGLGLSENFSYEGNQSIKSINLLDNLKTQAIIQKKIFAFYFGGTVSSIILGEYDSSLIKTDLVYFTLSNNQSWSFNASNFCLGSQIITNNSETVLINSASGQIKAPLASYNFILTYLRSEYQACVSFENIIKCSCPSGVLSFPNFIFYIDNSEFTLEPNYYINEENSVCSLKIALIDSEEDYWILGMPFLQKYYTVFDADNLRIGIAESIKSESNLPVVYEDTILVGSILFFGFFIGVAIILIVEKKIKWEEIEETAEQTYEI